MKSDLIVLASTVFPANDFSLVVNILNYDLNSSNLADFLVFIESISMRQNLVTIPEELAQFPRNFCLKIGFQENFS